MIEKYSSYELQIYDIESERWRVESFSDSLEAAKEDEKAILKENPSAKTRIVMKKMTLESKTIE